MITEDEVAEWSLDELKVGETSSVVVDIGRDEIERFAALCGDRNPLHTSDSYARSRGYPGVIAHGHLVAAPISFLAGHRLPGRSGLLLATHVTHVRPVLAGDRLTYRATVTQVSRSVGTVRVDVNAVNTSGETVLRGWYESAIRSEPAR